MEFFSVSELKVCSKIINSYNNIRENKFIGSQYEWLARLCESQNISGLQLCAHEDDKEVEVIIPMVTMIENSEGSFKIDSQYSGRKILAMATSPGFNPNKPRRPANPYERRIFRKMSPKKRLNYLNRMWRNPMVSNTYEPGSTAKLITCFRVSALFFSVMAVSDSMRASLATLLAIEDRKSVV